MPVSTNDFANKLWKVADFYDEFGLSPKIAALLYDASNIARNFSGIVDKNDELKAENAKLRETLCDLWGLFEENAALHERDLPRVDAVRDRMQELGVQL